MDVRYFRKSRSTFYETHDGGRRPATLEAAVGLAQERRHDLEDVPLQIRRLAALGVPPSFRAATAKLVIVALPLPVVGLHPGVYAEEAILLSRPSAKNLQVQMAQRPDAVEIQQRPEIPAFGPRPFIRRECADRTVLEVGVSWPYPPSLGAGGPETPSAGSTPDRYGRATRSVASPAKPEMIELRARSHIPSSSGKARNVGYASARRVTWPS
jgi:hypothetical protein